MIYLIDDKNIRQKNDFGWSEEKFAQYHDVLLPLRSIEDVVDVGEDLYSAHNVILYHESFLDSTSESDKADSTRKKIRDKAVKQVLKVAFFSGSQGSRSIDANGFFAELPVRTLYQNLETFLQKKQGGNFDLAYLLFGENPEIEEKLGDRLNQLIRKESSIGAVDVPGNNFFIKCGVGGLNFEKAINSATEEELSTDDVSDKFLSEQIKKWLNQDEYDHIFIPLCFGKSFSDFDGLRLASLVRCTDTPNQLKRIFIYGSVGVEELLDNEFIDILKTKNIELIPHRKSAFKEVASKDYNPLERSELAKEVMKLKLAPPLDYGDSHSIANEWAIYQWAKTMQCDETEELEKCFEKVEERLYFKYLRTISPINDSQIISKDDLKIKCKGKPKILLIDDESEKGWYEVFSYLLDHSSHVSIDYFENDFKNKTEENLIDEVLRRIEKEKIDIVLLDLYLIPKDLEGKDISNYLSIKILKKIKEYSKGIQVISFTATDKIQDVLALQDLGIDQFVSKSLGQEPGNTIKYFLKIFKLSIEKAIFLKKTHASFEKILKNIDPQLNGFKQKLKTYLDITFDLLNSSFSVDGRKIEFVKYSFLQLYNCLEDFTKESEIFERTGNELTLRGVPVARFDGVKDWKKAIRYISKKNNQPSYYIKGNDQSRFNPDLNFKISCVYLFLLDNYSTQNSDWVQIRGTRNTKVAHTNMQDENSIKDEDIDLIIGFMSKIFNHVLYTDEDQMKINLD